MGNRIQYIHNSDGKISGCLIIDTSGNKYFVDNNKQVLFYFDNADNITYDKAKNILGVGDGVAYLVSNL